MLHSHELFAAATAPATSRGPMPKGMLVFAHPDDEVIALGARLGRFGAAHFVHVTDGAPRDEQESRKQGFRARVAYSEARREEFARALECAGIAEAGRECLAIPDQEASLQLVGLTREIEARIEARSPEVVFTHPYEGGHPDHDACAFAVHHAVARRKRAGEAVPMVIEGAFYHAGPSGMETGRFLSEPEIDWYSNRTWSPHSIEEAVYRLSEEERRQKGTLLECFTTQREMLRNFAVGEEANDSERFRVAPQYDFGKPPHPGEVLYDQWKWVMTSGRFCELAAEAEKVLEHEAVAVCR